MNTSGVDSTVTPPTSASPHCPSRSAWAARCSATSDDEHAVSTVSVGPVRSSAYAIRPDAVLGRLPIAS
jgi:hypothetical protein